MTRPTLGREASIPTAHRPGRFAAVLASALDRGVPGSLPADVPLTVTEEPVTALPATPEPGPMPAPAPAFAPRSVPRAAPAFAPQPAPGPQPAPRPASSPAVRVRAVPTTTEPCDPRSPAGRVRNGRMALIAPPEPGPVPAPVGAGDRLARTVESDALPLWRVYLARRDPEARRRLVEHHTPLVRGVGAKLAVRLPPSVELADLVQSGTFGLMEAIDRFDPARGARFEGYAGRRIHGAMLDELRAQDWVPRTVRSRIREVERAREAVQTRTGRPASERELARELGVGLRDLRQAGRPMHLVSTDDPGAVAAAGPAVLADDDADPVLTAVRRETGDELRAAIAQLGERDRTVLRLYYLEDRTLAEIGVLLGVTESRVCQLHSRMISRLRLRLEPALAG